MIMREHCIYQENAQRFDQEPLEPEAIRIIIQEIYFSTNI